MLMQLRVVVAVQLVLFAVVADVGCGNGKYFGVRQDLAVLGSDRSEGGRYCLPLPALVASVHAHDY
jgi:hypothetical protein